MPTPETPTAGPPIASPARIRAATALRRLGHALVGHHVDDALLEELADAAESFAARLGAGAPRHRPAEDMKRRMFEDPPADGGTMEHFPDCVVSGKANPMGIAIDVRRSGDEAVASVRLGAAFEGAPGRAHGGVVAAVFDDVMGFVLSMERTPAYTGRLSVSYLAPTPLHTPITFRARLREREGRKLWITGRAEADGTVVAEAEGLFIAIPPERFGLPPTAGF